MEPGAAGATAGADERGAAGAGVAPMEVMTDGVGTTGAGAEPLGMILPLPCGRDNRLHEAATGSGPRGGGALCVSNPRLQELAVSVGRWGRAPPGHQRLGWALQVRPRRQLRSPLRGVRLPSVGAPRVCGQATRLRPVLRKPRLWPSLPESTRHLPLRACLWGACRHAQRDRSSRMCSVHWPSTPHPLVNYKVSSCDPWGGLVATEQCSLRTTPLPRSRRRSAYGRSWRLRCSTP